MKKALAPKDNGGLGLRFGLVLHQGYTRSQCQIDEISGKGANILDKILINEFRRLEGKGYNLLLFRRKKLGMPFDIKSGMTLHDSWSWTFEQFLVVIRGASSETEDFAITSESMGVKSIVRVKLLDEDESWLDVDSKVMFVY
ncbi:hypothetical protein Tco_0488069 [Tanacetum coccineum]